MENQPTVFIVDDEESIRQGLALACRTEGLNAETFSSALRFLNEYDPHRPGCLVLDIRMPDMDGLELQEKLVERNVLLPIIFITGHGDIPTSVRALKNGAMDFFEKPFRGNDLLDRVREALETDTRERETRAQIACAQQRMNVLTERERQVLRLLLQGKVTKEIAREMNLNNNTIDYHRKNMMERLNLNSIAELVHLSLLAKFQ